MATAETTIHLSWQQVDAWESQIAELRRKVEAAKVFLPPRGAAKAVVAAAPSANGGHTDTPPGDGMNFMGAVVEIANSVPAPISKEELRRRLRDRGAPESKLGTTLDVTLYKTKKANRITFKNGLISGAPQ